MDEDADEDEGFLHFEVREATHWGLLSKSLSKALGNQ